MQVLIIGGGASGMICAITSAQQGADVILIEKNEKNGKKIYITGKGRCNLTNCTDFDNFFNNIVNNKKFLFASYSDFDCLSCMNFFEKLGLKLKIERGNRVFPVSDKASDVIKVLEKEMSRHGVKVKNCEKVEELCCEQNHIYKVITDKHTYTPDKVVICTGGKSYPLTGSTGDGFIFAKKLGHTIVPPVPSLCGLIISKVISQNEDIILINNMPKLQGLSLKNVTAGIETINGKKLFEEFGEMLFTERGVSGPIILTLSSKINRMCLSDLVLCIDLKPALSENALDERIIRDFATKKNKMLKNSLDKLLPLSLIPFIIRLSGISSDKIVNSISKEERKNLVKIIKKMRFLISSLEDISSAIITSGGISVKEINPKSMKSKIVNNLYFAGEIIDIDALTGGFNLQLAFSTGYAVGTHINDN